MLIHGVHPTFDDVLIPTHLCHEGLAKVQKFCTRFKGWKASLVTWYWPTDA